MHFDSVEVLLAWLMDWFAQTFQTQVILKGGMELRLLDSVRHTNDLDLVFVPFTSRREVAQLVSQRLDGVDDLQYEVRLDSRSLRYLIRYGGQLGQVEIAAAQECPSIPMSMAPLAAKQGLATGVVRVMAPGTALAHKLAAWNERALVRDLYDTWFLALHVGAKMDLAALEGRLQSVRLRNGRPKAMTTLALQAKLEACLREADLDAWEDELQDILPREASAGVALQIRAGLLRWLAGDPLGIGER